MSHKTLNRLLYPSLSAKLRSETVSDIRRLTIGSTISGFVLDLDPGFVDYVFGLVDIYLLGRERVWRVSASLEYETASKAEPEVSLSVSTKQLPTTNVLMSLHFISGNVLLHPALDLEGG